MKEAELREVSSNSPRFQSVSHWGIWSEARRERETKQSSQLLQLQSIKDSLQASLRGLFPAGPRLCPAGSTRGEDGTNSLLFHFCSLFAPFLPHKGSSVRRDGGCAVGLSRGRGRGVGGALPQIALVLISFVLHHRQCWQNQCKSLEALEEKVPLICLLLTATVRMQDKQSCFSFISKESVV